MVGEKGLKKGLYQSHAYAGAASSQNEEEGGFSPQSAESTSKEGEKGGKKHLFSQPIHEPGENRSGEHCRQGTGKEKEGSRSIPLFCGIGDEGHYRSGHKGVDGVRENDSPKRRGFPGSACGMAKKNGRIGFPGLASPESQGEARAEPQRGSSQGQEKRGPQKALENQIFCQGNQGDLGKKLGKSGEAESKPSDVRRKHRCLVQKSGHGKDAPAHALKASSQKNGPQGRGETENGGAPQEKPEATANAPSGAVFLDEDVRPGTETAYACLEEKPYRADGKGRHVLELQNQRMQKENGNTRIAEKRRSEAENKIPGKSTMAGHGGTSCKEEI